MEEYTRHPVQPVSVDIKIVDGIFVKRSMFAAAGMMVPQHSHRYDHLSVVAAGAARVWADNELLGDFTAGDVIKIQSHTKHRFLTLMPDTVILCVHNTERTDGEIEIAEEHHLVREGA